MWDLPYFIFLHLIYFVGCTEADIFAKGGKLYHKFVTANRAHKSNSELSNGVAWIKVPQDIIHWI